MNPTDTSESSNRWGGLIELHPQQLVQIALLGVILGIAYWLVSLLIKSAIFVPLFCGDPTNSVCVGATDISGVIATVLVGIAGVLGLVRLSVFRPLLIALATAICLLGLSSWVAPLPWFEALAWPIFLYALCYVAFAWLVRPRAFLITAIAVVVVVILARVIPALA